MKDKILFCAIWAGDLAIVAWIGWQLYSYFGR